MAITVPVAGTEINAATFGKPVADEVNRLSALNYPPYNAKLPRGCIGYAYGPTADVPGIGSAPVQIQGMAVSWVTPSDSLRIYRTTICVSVGQAATVGIASGMITDQVTNVLTGSTVTLGVNEFALITNMYIEKPALNTAMTRVCALSTSAGTVGFVGSFNRNGFIMVEDIGGV